MGKQEGNESSFDGLVQQVWGVTSYDTQIKSLTKFLFYVNYIHLEIKMGLLNPLFRAIAMLPLVGPHEGHIKDLLMAGAKPLGWANDKDREELDQAVTNGILISKTYTYTEANRYHLYALPGYEDMALEFTILINKKAFEPQKFTPAEEKRQYFIFETLNETFQRTGHPGTFWEKKQGQILDKFVEVAMPYMPWLASYLEKKLNNLSDLWRLRSLEAGGQAFLVKHDQHRFSPAIFHNINLLIQSGKIIQFEKDIFSDRSFTLYGQPGQEKNMDRLAYINIHQQDLDDGLSWGELYGYTDRDIQFFADKESGNLNPIVEFVLFHTNTWRREMRQKLMMENGPNWKRNP